MRNNKPIAIKPDIGPVRPGKNPYKDEVPGIDQPIPKDVLRTFLRNFNLLTSPMLLFKSSLLAALFSTRCFSTFLSRTPDPATNSSSLQTSRNGHYIS